MTWRVVEEADASAIVYEWLLCDDDGELLGWIIRFNEEGPTHAWTPLGHIAAGRAARSGFDVQRAP